MVNEEQRREIGGVALLAVAFFLLLGLLPTSLLGALGAAWFPSGNMMGPAGALVRDGLEKTFGTAMFLAPAIFAFGGLKAGGWITPARANRWVILVVGLLLLVPTLLWIVVGTGVSLQAHGMASLNWNGMVSPRSFRRMAAVGTPRDRRFASKSRSGDHASTFSGNTVGSVS